MRIRSELNLSALARRFGSVTIVAAILVAISAPMLVAAPARALAQPGGAAAVERLNKQALEAYDSLSFDQAKTLLEQALAEARSGGLANAPVVARTHLNLGMVLIAGLQEAQGPARAAQREEAVEHFKSALKIRPDLTPPAGLFNPEVQAVFEETKEKFEAERASAVSAAAPPPKVARAGTPGKTSVSSARASGPQPRRGAGVSPGAEQAEEKVADDEEEDDGDAQNEKGGRASRFLFSIGLGSGLGVAKGKLDANKDIMQGGVRDNSWSGGLSPSRLGHLSLGIGYFASRALMVSVEGRIQIVSGVTSVSTEPSCRPSCSPPSTGVAVLAKASWFLAPAPLRPFLSAGLGAGTIRQVVKVNIPPTAEDPITHCGAGGNDACVDTVTGGPFLLAAGGGVVYELGSFVLLGSLTANVGIPKLMLNVDAVIGVGLRL